MGYQEAKGSYDPSPYSWEKGYLAFVKKTLAHIVLCDVILFEMHCT